jgi:Caspase domain
VLDPERTLAIVCGAKEWPNLDNLEAAEAFAKSANLIRRYLVQKKGLGISAERILWLFGKPSAAMQYELITTFLERQFEALDAPRGKGVLILFFYVGHGAFFGTSRTYCLLVKDTRKPLEADTSLRVASLARLFRSQAAESRRILFLDCCFAAEAARLFQGELDQAVSAKAREVVEQAPTDRGVALLCASSARNPASLESPTSYTFFGRQLIEVLTKGDSGISGPLTLRQLCELVRRGLRSAAGDDAPNPEVHVPDQAGGDLAAFPLFPNPAQPGSVTRGQRGSRTRPLRPTADTVTGENDTQAETTRRPAEPGGQLPPPVHIQFMPEPDTASVADDDPSLMLRHSARAEPTARLEPTARPKPIEDPLDSLDYFYQVQLEERTKRYRIVADLSTNRKVIELQINQLEQQEAKLDHSDIRLAAVERSLQNLRKQYERAVLDEEQATRDSMALGGLVDSFRTCKNTFKAQYRSATVAPISTSADFSRGLTNHEGEDDIVLKNGTLLDLLSPDQTDASEPHDQRGTALGDGIWSHFERGLVLAESSDLWEADSEFKMVVESTTGELVAFANFNRGVLATLMKQTPHAKRHYTASLESGQPMVAARSALNLGCIWQAAGRSRRAMSMYRAAMSYGDAVATPRAAFLLGRLHEKRGELSEAWLCYGTASDYDGHPFTAEADSRYTALMRSATKREILMRVLICSDFPEPAAEAQLWFGESSSGDRGMLRQLRQALMRRLAR